MSYIGKEPQFTQYPSKFFDGDGTAMTVSLDYAPPNAAALLVFIDGVRQDTSAYTLSGGTSLTFTGSVPSGTNNVQVVHMGLTVDVGTPGDGTVTSAKIADGAIVNADINASAAISQSKLSLDITNSDINASAAIATSKISGLAASATTDTTNASNLASGTVPTVRLGSGTASSSTFLRGDQSWATAGADNTPAFQMTNTANQTFSAGSYGTLDFNQTNWDTDSGCDLTNNKYVVPSGEGGKYLIYGYFNPTSLSGSSVYLRIKVNTAEIGLWNASAGNNGHHRWHPIIVYDLSAGDEIIWQLYVDNVSTTTGAQSGGGFRLAGV